MTALGLSVMGQTICLDSILCFHNFNFIFFYFLTNTIKFSQTEFWDRNSRYPDLLILSRENEIIIQHASNCIYVEDVCLVLYFSVFQKFVIILKIILIWEIIINYICDLWYFANVGWHLIALEFHLITLIYNNFHNLAI